MCRSQSWRGPREGTGEAKIADLDAAQHRMVCSTQLPREKAPVSEGSFGEARCAGGQKLRQVKGKRSSVAKLTHRDPGPASEPSTPQSGCAPSPGEHQPGQGRVRLHSPLPNHNPVRTAMKAVTQAGGTRLERNTAAEASVTAFRLFPARSRVSRRVSCHFASRNHNTM